MVISKCPDVTVWSFPLPPIAVDEFLVFTSLHSVQQKPFLPVGDGDVGLWDFPRPLDVPDLLQLSQRMELWYLVFYPDSGEQGTAGFTDILGS